LICLSLYWGGYVGHCAFIIATTTTTTTTTIITLQEAAWVKAERAA
jgi:hypothetical protein